MTESTSKPVRRRRGPSPSWLVFLLPLGLLILRLFAIDWYVIPSESMEPTIVPGDHVIVETFDIDPQPGDIVTFKSPLENGETLIKRVIATAGQTIDLKDGHVYIDGKIMADPYGTGITAPLTDHAENLSENVSFPLTVPDGCIFVMGDNRENSSDSRYFGCVPISSVTSEAILRYWPLDRITWLR